MYIESLEGGKNAKIVLAFDQDKEGAKYDLRFLIENNKDLFPAASVRMSKAFLNVEIPLLSKEVESAAKSIEAGLERYNKPYEEQAKGVENAEKKNDMILFQQSQANSIVNIRIPNSYQAISFFNSELLTVLNIHHKFKLEKAQNKDFNNDLNLKNKGQQSENKKAVYHRRKI
ncbi:hypothetical protein [Segetibacter koreensis]|uniref:hypothetical protein n=1 Tax=Segetibacter koreensis TaxID=398037 RepID=UPI000378AB20|nr:hypothetical protein [Segetibacter koreensis]